MSEKDTAAATGETPKDEPEIIEATVIDETPEPEDMSSGTTSVPKAKAGLATKAAWSLVALMTAFGAGVYLAPQFAPGLEAIGIRVAPSQAEKSSATTFDSKPLEDAIADLKADLKRQQEILAQQGEDLKAAADARAVLEADIGTLAAAGVKATDGAAVDPVALASLQAEIDRLSDDVARLSTLSVDENPQMAQVKGSLALARTEAATLKARLAAVEDAMTKVQAGALEASPRGRLVLSLARLKDRALVGQPFGAGLSALRPDFAALPALDQQMIGADLGTLEAHGGGITPYDMLVADFDAMAAAAVKDTEKAEGGFLANLFTVRRTDAGATGLDAELLKAEKQLLARDVAGAVRTLAALEGPALQATASWRSNAEVYVATGRAFDRLIERVSSSTLPLGSAAPDGSGPTEGSGQ